MNLNTLKYSIEEIYSIRFINDTNTINTANQNEEIETIPFPNFVFEFFTNKFIKKPLIDQHSLDILLSVDYYKKKDLSINIFAKFLNEEYESDDLEFYLYVRSCLEKEMKIMFIEVARENVKKKISDESIDNKCNLNIKSCLNVANAIYGNEQEELLNSFMKKIEDILEEQKNMGIKNNYISAYKILEITLDDYHNNKFNGNENENENEQDNEEFNNMKFSNNQNSSTYNNLQKSFGEGNISNIDDKISRLKTIIGGYIKQKELDVFFGKLLSSYSIYEKSQKNIAETMASIKELVSKKVNLLIKILFEKDENAWFNSLKLKNEDDESKEYFSKLIQLIDEMMQYDKLQEIPEELMENFSQTLLSTPELNNQINKLVMKRFE